VSSEHGKVSDGWMWSKFSVVLCHQCFYLPRISTTKWLHLPRETDIQLKTAIWHCCILTRAGIRL